jgi:indole-3-glycerol phosphate synthase
VARAYEAAGAAAISVLTDEAFFGGRMAHLEEVRAATGLPVLRKDFVLDPWQVWEVRAAKANAVLLIVAALPDADLGGLLAVAREAGLDTLMEVHDRNELNRTLASKSRLVEMNSRDLRTLAVSLDTTLALTPAIPDDVVAMAESGIRTKTDVRRLRDAGFDAFLVGEHLMGAPDPGRALKRLLRGGVKPTLAERLATAACSSSLRITSPADAGLAAEAGRRPGFRVLAHEPAEGDRGARGRDRAELGGGASRGRVRGRPRTRWRALPTPWDWICFSFTATSRPRPSPACRAPR